MNLDFKISKGGSPEISLTEHSIKKFIPDSISENDSTLRNSKVTQGITIEGVIDIRFLGSEIIETDDTRKLADFSVIPEFEDCYKDVSYEFYDTMGRKVREGFLEDVYIVSYEEFFANNRGVGEFKAVIRERSKGGTLA